MYNVYIGGVTMVKNITISVAVDRETEEQLKAMSAQQDKSISRIVRDAIIRMLEADKRG